MNATLYLPAKAIEKISNSKNSVLFLQYLLRNFDVRKDQVLLFEDETKNYVGTLKIASMWKSEKFFINYWKLRKKIAYRDRTIWSYLTKRKTFYIYFVGYSGFHRQTIIMRKKAVQ